MRVKPASRRLSKEEQAIQDQKRLDHLTRLAALVFAGTSVYYFFIKLLFL
ncbi:hypothetical protein TEGAF0_10440 [Sediminibacterium sp. TEGAF015]|nr:hypothetical protein TEGAF0_10440 [Sediminibacterium sp. TEGAF015]